MIGLFVQSPWVALCGLLGVTCATAVGILLSFDKNLVQKGILGYNGVLVGLALATFHGRPWDPDVLFYVVSCSGFSTVLAGAMAELLHNEDGLLGISRPSLPALTMPFNLAMALVLLGGAAHFPRFQFKELHGLASSSPLADDGDEELTPDAPSFSQYGGKAIAEGTLRGFGQVFLADDLIAGACVAAGMALSSPAAAAISAAGSFLGALTGVWVGADPAEVQAGLWGYNSVLGAVAVGGMFYVPSRVSLSLSGFCAVICALCFGSLRPALSVVGLPAMTLPFCIITPLFLLLHRGGTKAEPVPLPKVSTPEIHYSTAALALSREKQQQQQGHLSQPKVQWTPGDKGSTPNPVDRPL